MEKETQQKLMQLNWNEDWKKGELQTVWTKKYFYHSSNRIRFSFEIEDDKLEFWICFYYSEESLISDKYGREYKVNKIEKLNKTPKEMLDILLEKNPEEFAKENRNKFIYHYQNDYLDYVEVIQSKEDEKFEKFLIGCFSFVLVLVVILIVVFIFSWIF